MTEQMPDAPGPGTTRDSASAGVPVFQFSAPAVRTMLWQGKGLSIEYEARAEQFIVPDGADVPMASMFAVSYTAQPRHVSRPITFLFNGGPGSASLWLNIGGFGPKRARTATPQPTPPAPYAWGDNPFSLLPYSDLVFVDAVGTGYSRIIPPARAESVWGVDADIDIFARFVQTYLTRMDRWESPRFLFGESYGTTRAAGLAYVLQNRGIDISGIVLLSTILDLSVELPGNIQDFVNLLPSYAATARFHGVAGFSDLSDAEFDEAAVEFAEGDFARALSRGDAVSDAEEHGVAATLSSFVGIDVSILLARHLRIEMEDFRELLLAKSGVTVGRFDSRFVARSPYVVGHGGFDPATNDAATAGVNSAHLAAFRTHLHREIGFSSQLAYLPLNNMVVESAWNWSHKAPGIDQQLPVANLALDLGAAMRRNPNLQVLVMGGRYDLATPYLSARHDISQLFLAQELRTNVTFCRYESGHMAFVDEAASAAMIVDLSAFYGRAVAAHPY